MKGVLMKAGQLVSFIFEALPEDAQAALATLQADAAPMAPSLAAGVVTSELGNPPERVFLDWTDLPVAAASIGQVHRAITAGGLDVAVKVQYPGVGEAIESDLDAAEMMYAMFSAMMLKGLDAKAFVDELRARMREELDYELEARNVTEFAALYAGHPWVRVPRLVPELSTKRLLTTEWVDGMSFEQFRTHGVVRHQAARRRGPLAVRPARRAAVRDVQRRPAPRQLQVPPRRQHHVPRLRPREALDARRVGVAQPDARRDRRAPRSRSAGRGDGDGRLPAPRPRTRRRARLRLREQPVHAVPHRRVHVQPGVDARHAQRDLRHPGPARTGDRAAQHATELRDPRSGRVGRRARSSASSKRADRGGRCCSSTSPTASRRPSSAPPKPPGAPTASAPDPSCAEVAGSVSPQPGRKFAGSCDTNRGW